MSSTDSLADEHAYFQAIEERFIQLRGAPLLLSPADWQLARRWFGAGIPLALVLDTLETVFSQRRERGAKGRVQGLRYCAPAIEAAWQHQAELQATGLRAAPETLDVPRRLAELASAVRAVELDVEGLPEAIAALDDTPEETERQLSELDRELLERAARSLEPAAREEIAKAVEESLARLRSRVTDAELEQTRQRLHDEAVRRRLKLPFLSLFEDSF
jgi:hypothetical protein